MSCRRVSHLIPARPLGALDSAERRLLDAHLADCDECRRELASFGPVTDGLTLVAHGVAPSADLRRRVLAEAREASVVESLRRDPSRPVQPEEDPTFRGARFRRRRSYNRAR